MSCGTCTKEAIQFRSNPLSIAASAQRWNRFAVGIAEILLTNNPGGFVEKEEVKA